MIKECVLVDNYESQDEEKTTTTHQFNIKFDKMRKAKKKTAVKSTVLNPTKTIQKIRRHKKHTQREHHLSCSIAFQ